MDSASRSKRMEMIPNVEYKTGKFIPNAAKYEMKYVAYLDILGFSELIRKSITDTELHKKICNVLTSMYRAQPDKYVINPEGKHIGIPKNPDGICVYVFSDNILMTAPITLGGLNKLANEIWTLYGNLAFNCNSLVRGSIVKGLMYDDTQIAYGPGLIDAYQKESNIAIYPRIILSDEVYKDYIQLLETESMTDYATKEYHCFDEVNWKLENISYSKYPITVDWDGLAFLDVLSCYPNCMKHDPQKKIWGFINYSDWLIIIRNIIINNLASNKDEKIKMKYIWYRNYFNKTIKDKNDFSIDLVPEFI